MLVGLQGAGKTTMAAKLALHLRRNGQRPMLVAADTRRPAAIEQLKVLGKQLDITVYDEGTEVPPPQICANALKVARERAHGIVILDTSGRLQIDEALMDELVQIKDRTNPQETLLVVDAMTGQDSVKVAEGFNNQVALTGLIMTKIDGDARGGAAISVREVTGVPIKFLGTGEKLNELEIFYPDRLASRILGMGDVLTLIERAEASMDEEEAQAAADKLMDGRFNLDDFLKQLRQVKKIGPISQLLEMVPGFNQVAKQISSDDAERQMARTEAIISSMTIKERQNPRVLNGNRKRRIATGSGTSVQEINQLLTQFRQMQKMMKQLRDPRKLKGLMDMFGGGMRYAVISNRFTKFFV
jgi:signal recognition particle subunit SRP54